MDDEDNQYELDRQRIIAENRALLDSLGFEEGRGGSAVLGIEKQVKLAGPRAGSAASSVNGGSKKRKPAAAAGGDEGPRRRSGRLAGIEATAEQVEERAKEEEKQLEKIRIISRKVRDQVMAVGDMMDDASPEDGAILKAHLSRVKPVQRRLPTDSDTAADAYAEPKSRSKDVEELKSHFKSMHLRANPRVTPERVYCMAVHPDPTRTLVCAGDKHGVVGMWDALGQPEEPTTDGDDDTSTAKHPDGDDFEGRVWQIQAHARSSVSCMKFDPVGAQRLFTSSYDCTLRSLDLSTGISTELLTLNTDPDDDILINHFDVAPNGHEVWLSDRLGGITHLDLREPLGGKSRARRWVVQDEGRGGKLGGMSVNPLMPHIIATAGNDQHLRIWDVRQLHAITPRAADILTPPAPPRRRTSSPPLLRMPATPPVKLENGNDEAKIKVKAELAVDVESMEVKAEVDTPPRRTTRNSGTATPRSTRKAAASTTSTPAKQANGVKEERKDAEEKVDPDWRNTHLYASIPVDRVQAHMNASKGDGKALHRGAWQHGKSCSAAYWDPWGRRVLTTSYDDKLRVFNVAPSAFETSDPIPTFKPTTVIPHNCQTGRWLTILRAQWSLNTDVAPFFTVGNMKRSLDVVAGTGEKICSLWTDVVTAVPAVTAAHPGRIDHVFGANTSGKVQMWTSAKSL